MALFVTLTDVNATQEKHAKIRVNMDHVIQVGTGQRSGRNDIVTVLVYSYGDRRVEVTETPEEIDALLVTAQLREVGEENF